MTLKIIKAINKIILCAGLAMIGSLVNPLQAQVATATVNSPAQVGISGLYSADLYLNGDGTTDDTSALNSLLQTVYNAGGGTILFSSRTYLFNGAIIIPSDSGGASAKTHPLRLTSMSPAAAWDGYWANTPPTGGAVLDLRYTGTDTLHPAKITSLGRGALEIDHLSLKSGGTDNFPFLLTTATTLHVHDNAFIGNSVNTGTACLQDAVILGGTTIVNGGNTAPFQGYGTIINHNWFTNIREGVLFQSYANAIVVSDNTFSLTCGSPDSSHAAIHIKTPVGVGPDAGNTIRDNLIEQTYYPYGIILDNAVSNVVTGNSFWDAPSPLGAVYCTSNSTGNLIVGGQNNNGSTAMVVEQTPGYNTVINGGYQKPFFQFAYAPLTFNNSQTGLELNNGAIFGFAGTTNGTPDITITRTNGPTLNISTGTAGILNFTGADLRSGQATNYIDLGSAGTGDAWAYAAGTNSNVNLHLRAKGTGNVISESQLSMNGNALNVGVMSTTTRNSLTGVTTGAMVYDATLHLPLWYNGTAWTDAAGTTR